MDNAKVKTINYAGIFLACYSEDGRKYTHMVRNHSLVYVFAGELLLEEDGVTNRIQKGECVFIRRDHRVNMTKKSLDDEQFKAIFLTFNRNFLRAFYNKMNRKLIPQKANKLEMSVVKIPPRPDIMGLFHSLTPYFDSNIQPSPEIIDLKEQEGVYSLLQINPDFHTCLFDFTEPWKIDIMDFLNENYMCELTLEEIAEFTGRSLATFKRDFKKLSDLTPQKWLIHRRLEEAYDRIKVKGQKAGDVYIEVGFKNRSHFYSAFKRQYGFSPGM